MNKAFVLSLEAVICLVILVAFISSMEKNVSIKHNSLKEELAYQQAQDIVETCLKKREGNQKCFSKINEVNKAMSLNSNGSIKITRFINGKQEEIVFSGTLEK